VLALLACLFAVAAMQLYAADPASWFVAYGLIPAELSVGRWTGLFTSQFLHGGLGHLLINAVAALAFGAPVARLFGSGAGGAALFFAFFLVCGALAGLAFWAVQPHTAAPLVGASGAVSGLMGAAARLVDRPGRVGPLVSRTVLSFAGALVLINLVVAALGFAPGAGAAVVAWEAHLGGLAAGLLLIGPAARLVRRRDAPAAPAEPSSD
jgi:membrane associated rhomboid family serine protease